MFFRLLPPTDADEFSCSFDKVLIDHLSLTLNEFVEKKWPTDYSKAFSNLESFAHDHEAEILLIVNFQPQSFSSPVSFFVSWEIDPVVLKKYQKSQILLEMTELAGHFLEEFFGSQDDFAYSKDWEPFEYQGKKYFVMTSREDIRLTLEANALLQGNNKN